MIPSNKQNKSQHRKGDIVVEIATKIKRSYDGNKWRRLCSVHKCERMAQRQGLCMRHFSENNVQQQSSRNISSSSESPMHLPVGDFFMVVHDRNDSINNIKDYIKQNDLYHPSKFFFFDYITIEDFLTGHAIFRQ
jgi:hypothetical protein